MKKERELWLAGITSWDEVVSNQWPKQLPLLSGFKSDTIDDLLEPSRQALELEDAEFFASRLPRTEHYRIALSFPSKTMFLDIETTGLSRYYNHITLVGWSMAGKYGAWIRGEDESELRQILTEARVVVTFNGSLFDIPFVRKEFPDLKIPSAHVDLRFFARRFGVRGGQKEIEAALGLERASELRDLDGREAPLLWHKHIRGDSNALELLVTYNCSDILGMQGILDATVETCLQAEPIPSRVVSPFRFAGGSNKLQQSHVWLNEANGDIGVAARKSDLPISLSQLVTEDRLESLKIVGIDLTGSETRASGWCMLSGRAAKTDRINSDSELIEATIDSKPLIVSIDSPLSLPAGRAIATDDDPGREKYGITRYCERVLRKRGVNVYPSLIPSMQNLTARGIHLAKAFRAHGLPVIESFPGAAQDILQIPRKRASLELLKGGLEDFGIRGISTGMQISHDELDAITSAIVGVLFWLGKFEALGNDEEEYLIIPDLSADEWGKRRIIGFSGNIAAGKTTAGRQLERLGFAYTRYSRILEKILRSEGMDADRESLQQFGEEVYNVPGQRWLNRRLVQDLPPMSDVAIDGLRHPEDHSFLVEEFGPDFLHIHIDSSDETRRDRYVRQGKTDREFSMATRHPVEASVIRLSQLAHLVVPNHGTLDDFARVISEAISSSRRSVA